MKRTGPFALLAVLAIPPRPPSIEIQDFDFVESKSQKRTLQVRATQADVYKPEDILRLNAPRVLAWSQEDSPFAIEAKTGLMNQNSQDLELRGDARVLTPDGYAFSTDNLSYAAELRFLRSEDPVEVTTLPQAKHDTPLKMTGVGLRISLEDSVYDILKNVRAEQKISASASLTVRSRRSQILPKLRQAAFLGAVTARSAQLDLKGERLVVNFENSRPRLLVLDGGQPKTRIQAQIDQLNIKSRGLEVTFDAQGELLESQALGNVDAVSPDGTQLKAEKLYSDVFEGKRRLRLQGEVTILTGARVATCEEALFFPDSGDILLERVATVKSVDQVLEGEKIRLSTKNPEIRVETARGQVGRKQIGLR